MLAIKTIPQSERPRERLLKQGARNLSNSELLAILIRCGNQSMSAIQIAQQLLRHSDGKVAPLFNLNNQQLLQLPGIGPATTCQIKASLELARRQLQENLHESRPVLHNVHHCKTFLHACLRAYEHEVFACLFLDRQLRVSHYEELFHGSIDQTIVHPREVVKQALKHNASNIILAHNHPSGCCKPSKDDYQLTIKLGNILQSLQIRLMDHIIVGDPEVYSMAEQDDLNDIIC